MCNVIFVCIAYCLTINIIKDISFLFDKTKVLLNERNLPVSIISFWFVKVKIFLIETDNDRKLTTPYPNNDYECEENYESDLHYSDIRSKEYKWEVVYKKFMIVYDRLWLSMIVYDSLW